MAMVSPSRLISAIDGLIPTGILLCCLGAFVPKEVMFSVDYDDQPTSQSLVTSKDWSLLGMAVNTVDYYVKFGIKILNYAKKSLTSKISFKSENIFFKTKDVCSSTRRTLVPKRDCETNTDQLE